MTFIDAAGSRAEHQTTFRKHVQSVMNASKKSTAEHIHDVRGTTPGTPEDLSLANANADTTVPGNPIACPIDPSIFPSISQLTTKFAKLKLKSLREGKLGGELLAKCPQLVVRIYHPIVTKFIYTSPPSYDGREVCSVIS